MRQRDRAGTGSLPFAIRAGLNTGECDLVDGDVFGLNVNIAARINALARAGEVLVSVR